MFNRHEIILFLKPYEAFMQDVYIRWGVRLAVYIACLYCLAVTVERWIKIFI